MLDDPLPRDPDLHARPFTTAKLLGAAVAFLGGAVLIGWYLYQLQLVTVPRSWVPMQYNTAVGFVLTGAAVVAHCVGRRRVAFACGAIAAGIGSVALAEQLLGRQLAIVDLLFGGAGAQNPAKMAPNTALCFSLAGGLILLYCTPVRSRRWQQLAGSVLAALLAAAGFVGLMGYVLEVPEAGRVARFTEMEVHTALGFVALGVAFFAMVDHFRGGSVERRLPAWSSWAAGLSVGLLILAVWVGLTSSEERLRSLALTKTHEAAITHASQRLQGHLRQLERLSRLFGHSLGGTSDELQRDVETYLEGLPGLAGLIYCDERDRMAFVHGPEGEAWGRRTLAEPSVAVLMGRSRRSGELAVSSPTQGEERLWICVPVEQAGKAAGRLIFEHELQPFFDGVFDDGVGRTFHIELASQSDVVFYRASDEDATPPGNPSNTPTSRQVMGNLAVADQVWSIRGASDPFWVSGRRSVSNTLILWVGIFLAVAIAFVVRKSELLRQRAVALLAANRTISENATSLEEANASLAEQAQNLRATEERLRRAAREKRRVLDSLSAFLIGVDGEGVVTEWNFVSSELFGLRSSETVGKPFDELELGWDEDCIRDAMAECRASGERVRRDHVAAHRRGERDARIISFTINPTNDDGRHGFAIIGSDVTERQMLEMQLHHAQRLESVGTLAAGIAHEINTPMQFVSDNVRFLAQSVGPITEVLKLVPGLLESARRGPVDEARLAEVERKLTGVDVDFVAQEMPQALEETMEGVERVTTIVRAMKDFSHPGEAGMAPADVNKAIETTLAVARNEYKYHADIETDFGELGPVECWVADLNQVFLNLLVNGVHAIRDKLGEGSGLRGKIKISTRREGDTVEIRVADSGTGIPEEIRSKIFDQFFTTKGLGRGTGLGLAICRAVVVEKHGGSIDCESVVGEGTTFIVRIPAQQALPSGNDAAHPVR